MRRLVFLIALVACSKKPADKPVDAGPTVLEPMETPEAAPPPTSSLRQPGPAPWALAYDEKLDLGADAGSDSRCPDAGTVDAPVRITLVKSGTGIELAIPATKTSKQLWLSSPQGVGSCSASRSANGDALRFHCSEDLASFGGKVYARGSNVIVSYISSVDGQKHEHFDLPCGSRPKLEPVACPRVCREIEGQCACQPIGVAPAPSR